MKTAKYARDAILDRLSLYLGGTAQSLSAKPLRKRFNVQEPIERVENITDSILPCEPLHVEQGELVDTHGRKRVLKGINVDLALKLPVKPYLPSYEGDCADKSSLFFDGDNVSFVGRPFPVDEAEQHFSRIKLWGYNTIRYLVTWEAIEHEGPGKYDAGYVEYTIAILRIIEKVGGLYVFLECHQDVWLRFSGGSGAPLWTLYCAGLQPKRFHSTEAAVLHNHPKFERPHDQECYPKMLWTSNYTRLASFTMFTLFFAGKTYFPNLKINGQNIQDYLQDRHMAALHHLWKAVAALLPEMLASGALLGFELLNEPNCGLVGHPLLYLIPPNQQLRVDTCPTAYQCMRLGMGLPVEVDVYKITLSGPQKDGTRLVDPKGDRAWLLEKELAQVDRRYGWQREGWRGRCIYAGVKIWKWNKYADMRKLAQLPQKERLDFLYHECELLWPGYFHQVSPKILFNVVDEKLPAQVDMDFFVNNMFVDYYVRFRRMVRSVAPVFVLLQLPVLECPPRGKNDPRDFVDDKTIYCPHYYDGMSLMFKSWNVHYNVDTLGIMRGRYLNPILGLVLGERAIRNCIKRQFIEMKAEAQEHLGPVPVLMLETGMPFDMDNKRAYEDGRYVLQTGAIDALAYALEGAGMHHTYWCYLSSNSHKCGDRWNNEDFSFWLPDDRDLVFDDDEDQTRLPSRRSSVTPLLKTIRSIRENGGAASYIRTKIDLHKKALLPNLFKKSFCPVEEEPVTSDSSLILVLPDMLRYKHIKKCYPLPDGVRAVSAVVRPFLVATMGTVVETEFDIRSLRYVLTLKLEKVPTEPTVVFVPKWHYPYLNYNDISLTCGHVKYNDRLEYLEWWHDDELGNVTMVVKNNSGSIESYEPKESETCPIT